MTSLIRRKDPGQAWETEADTGGGNSPQVLLNARGTIGPAEITTLHSVGVTLAAAPGQGTAWAAYFGSLVIIGGSTPYADGGDLVVATLGHSGDALLQWTGSQDFLKEVGGSDWLVGTAAQSGDPWASYENMPLLLMCRTADFTAGNGSLAYSVFYELVTAP